MKKILASGIAAAFFLGAFGAFSAPTRADDTTGATAPTGTARISLISGAVAVQHADATGNVAAAVNAPLLSGDALTTGAQSRAEIQLDGASVVRLGGNAQARFSDLDPNATVVQLALGTASVDLLQGSTMRPEVDTPSISILPDDVGRYRVTVTSDGRTLLTVREGTADVTTPQGSQTVSVGSTLVAQGPAANPSISTRDAVAVDDFDAFNTQRDDQLAQALSSSSAYGSYDGQDLGAYGQWSNDPTYGNVWVPANQTADWAPYRDGQWVWEGGYYGYTWVSNEPWGWAPYHYGRWAYLGHRGWGWCPPGRNASWSPALVAFFGFGSGGGLSIAFGNVGWVPLGPRDSFRPWWGNGRDGRIAYNATTINNFGNYRHGGATSVGAQRWTQGDFRHNQRVSPGVRAGVAFNGRAPIAPTSHNMRYNQSRLPSSLANRRFAPTATFARTNRGWQTRNTAQNPRGGFGQSRGSSITPTDRSGARSSDPNRVGTQRYQQQPRSQQQPQRTNGDPWSRFNDQRGNQQPQYRRPQQQQPQRRYQQPQYQQPQQRQPQYQQPQYQQPQQQQPQRRYQQPQYQPPQQRQPQYQQPQQRQPQYQQPQQQQPQYQQPQRTYQQPQYQQQQRTYQQPQRSNSQPARSQSRDSNSSSNSDHHGHGRPPG
ncbi:MAG TPA: DUF6600 domain-containing protein [Candidatus Baltobacteraceae bacterium]